MKLMRCALLLAIAVACLANTAAAQNQDVWLTISGRVEHPLSLTGADFDKYPRHSVVALTRDGKEHKYEGIAIADLLKAAGVKFGEALHMEVAATYLLAEASDGYRVVFALPEFDSVPADRQILIADKVDGNSLPPAIGPLQLIAPSDKGHDRWVRQLKSLSLQFAPAAK